MKECVGIQTAALLENQAIYLGVPGLVCLGLVIGEGVVDMLPFISMIRWGNIKYTNCVDN